MTGVLRAELLKLRTTRATGIVLAASVAAVAAAAALAWYVTGLYDRATDAERATVSVSSLEELTLMVNQLGWAVLGVLSMTTEHRTGLIRGTFAAVPARWRVLTAKAVTVSGAALLTATTTAFATYAVGDAIIGAREIPQYDGPADVPALLAAGPSAMVFALLGLGLGAVTRSAAGSITAVVLLWYALPMVALNLPAPWDSRIGAVLLGRLDAQLAGVDLTEKYGAGMPEALLPPWGAALAMAAYAAAALIPAYTFLRRDVR